MEHHSNIVPWHFLRERKGAVIKWAPVDEDGNFLLDEFEKLITPRTKIVAITHMSNVLGTVTPMRDIIRIAHAHRVPVLVDGPRARSISMWTCAISMPISTCSRATRSMGPRASAFSTARRSCSRRCRPIRAAAR